MAVRLCLIDETTAGERREAGDVLLGSAKTTLRELIRERVRREVARYNESPPDVFRGLVEPEESERILNPERGRRTLDWEKQADRAVRSFRSNGFLVIARGRQLTDLDEEIDLADGETVSFLRLVPLIGG